MCLLPSPHKHVMKEMHILIFMLFTEKENVFLKSIQKPDLDYVADHRLAVLSISE